MKQIIFSVFIILLLAGSSKIYAGDGHFHPDSLQNITVFGTTIIDSSMMHLVFYLDSDGDGLADYRLNFGPYWYEPDSSDAVRPVNGQQITIDGGLSNGEDGNFQPIVVYEIDGAFWRNPTEPGWNMMGGHQNDMGHHNGMGYAFGWMHDSVRTTELSGTVITDTTFVFMIYYLDVDSDSLPDYYLNFGPPWFEPENGTVRPINGEAIQVTGGLLNNHEIPMLIVYELNGQTWRDSSAFGNHFGGGWMVNNMTEGRYFYSPFDSLDGMFVHPGWQGGTGHGHNGMMSDSLFCQILEVFPQNIPARGGEHVLAGYEIALFNPDGSNNMWMNGMNGGHMNMNSEVDYALHYNDIQLQGERIDETTIEVKYWDDQTQTWLSILNPSLDAANNNVSFASKEVSNYVILSGQQTITALDEQNELSVKGFTLRQNYPNPFNPTTTIVFQLSSATHVRLIVYNALGQKILSLLDAQESAGEHRITLDGRTISTGVYYYELDAGGQKSVRKMVFVK